MKLHRFRALGVLTALLLFAIAATAQAAPVTVNLRVEGSGSTVFEGEATTDGKVVTTASGGSHLCDGTQGGQSNPPGGTPTTALDDAAHANGFTWDGRYGVGGYDDFLVERVAGDGTVGTFGSSFWGLSVNRVAASVGGCQMRVSNGDTVLWEWTDGTQVNLQLTAPATAQVGQAVPVTVQQYGTDGSLSPASGASVDGQLTDSNGQATLSFSSAGTQHLKATRADAVRSNAADVCVYTPGSGQCNTSVPPPAKDTVAPTVKITGIRDGARFHRGHGPRKLSGTASDSGGLFQVYFRLRRHTHAGCQWYSSKRSVFTRPRSRCTARFQRVGTKSPWSYLLPKRLPKGRYTLEEKALDLVFNRGIARVTFTVR